VRVWQGSGVKQYFDDTLQLTDRFESLVDKHALSRVDEFSDPDDLVAEYYEEGGE
jgi:hypothetical protein